MSRLFTVACSAACACSLLTALLWRWDKSQPSPSPQLLLPHYAGGSTHGSLPRVFVYDIPPHLLDPGSTHDMRTWYGLEHYLWRAFQAYEHRTYIAEEADFFFVPHVTASLYRISGKNKSASGAHLQGILEHIASAHPYFDHSASADHVMAFAHDSFHNVHSDHTRLPPAFRQNTVFVLNQGDDSFVDIIGFDVRRCIVTLPLAPRPPQIWQEHGLVRKPRPQRRWLAVFRGSIQPEVPAYSKGFRQALFATMQGDSDILFGEHSESYILELIEAKFCLFLRGWHVWSERLGFLINAGCIPVIISDHFALPFWQHLDWSRFSVRISQKDALQPGHIKRVLLAVSEEQAQGMEEELARLQHSLSYNLPVQAGDIFQRILIELSARKTPVRPMSGLHLWPKIK